MKREFEQEIRDAMRQVDSMRIPVQPLDPDDLVSMASDGHRVRLRSGTARRLLALAASVVLVASVGLAAWSWLDRRDVVAAVPSPSPESSATMPARLGDTATWTLAAPDEVSAASKTLTLSVTRLGCAGGKTGVVLAPSVSMSDTMVIIRSSVEPKKGFGSCQRNEPVQVTLTLSEPVGNRDLVDAACLDGDAVNTAACSGGAVRWTP
jgi:hypothetical protein